VLFGVGLALLAGAVVAVVRQREAVSAAVSAARGAEWWLVVLVVMLPGVNLALTSLSFSVVMGRRGRVGKREMLALIWAAWLGNQLPLRAGLVGRVAYHKAVNRIGVGESVRASVELLVVAVCATGLLVGVVVVNAALGGSAWTLGGSVAVVVGLLFGAAGLMRARSGVVEEGAAGERAGGLRGWWAWVSGGQRHAWRYPAALGLRFLDVVVWGARYALVFALVGYQLDVRGAAATAATSQVAMLTPVPVGLREWVVGMTGAWLPEGLLVERGGVKPTGAERAGGAGEAGEAGLVERATPGLLADTTNRAAELVLTVPGGLVAGVYLGRRWRGRGRVR
jgi:hypothetical protein